jgi:hypothetical protein
LRQIRKPDETADVVTDQPHAIALERIKQFQDVVSHRLLLVVVRRSVRPAGAAKVGTDDVVCSASGPMSRRHSHQFCGQPCSRTTGSPCPASATCAEIRKIYETVLDPGKLRERTGHASTLPRRM